MLIMPSLSSVLQAGNNGAGKNGVGRTAAAAARAEAAPEASDPPFLEVFPDDYQPPAAAGALPKN